MAELLDEAFCLAVFLNVFEKEPHDRLEVDVIFQSFFWIRQSADDVRHDVVHGVALETSYCCVECVFNKTNIFSKNLSNEI